MNIRKVTINDVARIAQVSKTTVSCVVNRRQSGFHISEETARRVLKVCRELNYSPDETALRLSEYRKTPLRLLVASPWLYAQFSDFMAQLNIVLHRHELYNHLQVTYASYSAGELKSALRASVLKRYDAVLVVGTNAKDDQWLTANAEKLAKIVLMNRRVEGFLSCSGDDQEAVTRLVQKVDLNHYDEALTVVSSRRSYCEQLRCNGFAASCAAAGIPCETFSAGNYDTLEERLLPTIVSRSRKTLLFIPQYAPAALLLKKAQEAGLAIPDRLGILTFDRHSLLVPFISPALTTVDPCLEEMAEKTMELVYGMRDYLPQQSCVIQEKLCPGGTTVNL